MKTENFAALDLQKEYYRTFQAARVAATASILLSAAWCWLKFQSVASSLNAITYNLAGGYNALPESAKLILPNANALAGCAALGGLSALACIWVNGRSIPRMIYLGTSGAACFLIIGMAFEFSSFEPWRLLTHVFRG